MPAFINGAPHVELEFDKEGTPIGAPGTGPLAAMAQTCSDIFVFSHGWNNSPTTARKLYERFFDAMEASGAGTALAGLTLGTVGVIWPSVLWPDDAPADH